MMKYLSSIFVLLFISQTFSQKQLYINEVMGDNNDTMKLESYDWLELYNPGENALSIKGWYLSDNLKDLKKWKFPNVKIEGNSFLIINLSGVKTRSKKQVHANFKLSAQGETLVLSNSKGLIIDCLKSAPCGKGISYGRSKDGGETFERFSKPTKSASNIGSDGILFSHDSGLYDYFLELKLTSKHGDSIRYTEDGSLPNCHSKVYESKIKINSRQDEVDVLTQISKNGRNSKASKNFKGNVIRAATFRNGNMSSNVYTKSYFTYPDIANKYKGFNILSLATDQNNLFQKDSGIYVGDGRDLDANYNKRGANWQREAHVILFDTTGKVDFSQRVNIRIHGQTTRKYPSKSFRIYADEKYLAPFISTTVFSASESTVCKKLIIKSSMGDLQKTVFKDECTAYICRNLNVDMLDFSPCILFINGEYWGIYNLREFLGKHYVSNKYNANKDSVNIVKHGDGNRYSTDHVSKKYENTMLSQFYDSAQSINFAEASSYQIISDYFNVESVIDYYCANLFFGNTDYLENNNKLWQIGENGRWNQFLFDLDYCWMDAKMDNISPLINPKSSSRHPAHMTLLFRMLISNPTFKAKFLSRMEYLLENDFSSENLVEAILLFKTNYEPQMRAHANKWSWPGSVYQWEKKVSYLVGFAKTRHAYFRAYLLKLQ